MNLCKKILEQNLFFWFVLPMLLQKNALKKTNWNYEMTNKILEIKLIE